MRFWIITKLCFHLLFCQRVSSSRYLFSQNETFFENPFHDVMEKFFVELDEVYLQKSQPRHVAVVGASTNDLQQAQPLFASHPYSVCKGVERCVYSQRFSHESLVFVFLEDLSKETFQKTIKILLPCKMCKVLFISKETVQLNDVWLILTWAVENYLPYSRFAHFGNNGIELYSEFVATNCTMQVRLVTVWNPGVGLAGMNTWAHLPREMNGCPVTVSSLTFTPKMIIEENENGSLTIVGGREGKLLLALAEKLNFTVNLSYPSIEDQLKYSRKVAILIDVATGRSEIGIGRLRPTDNSEKSIAVSFWYDEECITWGVPLVIKWSNNIVWVEFSWEVWTSVGIVFAIGCVIKYFRRKTVRSKTGKRKGPEFLTVVLDVLALHLGNPIQYASSSPGGRFILIAYLYYAIVIVTAYKTSLASILATDRATPKIINAQGIIDANLKVGGSLYDYNILKAQVNDSEVTAELLKRFVVNNDDSAIWDKLFLDRDWAILGRRSLLNYERQMILKAQESVRFDVLKDCVLAYPTVMLFQPRSFIQKRIDNVIRRLGESGILTHWDIDELDHDKLLKHKIAEMYFANHGVYKFWNIFILYSFCIFISLFTFLIEVLGLALRSRN